MRKYLLPQNGNFYKANFHTHSTISDGVWSPQKIKEEYQKRGYSIIAYTDHEIMIPHPELCDENFLAITATEFSVNDNESVVTNSYLFKKVYHLNFLSKDPNKTAFPGWSKNYVWLKQTLPYVTPEMEQRSETRHYDVDSINDIIKRSNEEGFLVTLNHPVWSIQDFTDYSGLKGLWGVEVYNTGCVVDAFLNDTTQPLDDLLRRGVAVSPIAADDNHNGGDNAHDSFGGWTVVKANDLNYSTIISALEKGDFYSSSGPQINELYIEDGILHVATSPCRSVAVISEHRFSRVINATDSPVTEAQFNLNPYFDNMLLAEKPVSSPYIRVEIVDEKGYHAWSRAYSLDELK